MVYRLGGIECKLKHIAHTHTMATIEVKKGPPTFNVVIVGGGLVGSLAAVFFGKRGYQVDVYDLRSDPRTLAGGRGRSINLALSCRGLEALQSAGADKLIRPLLIPMKGRLIHGKSNPATLSFQPYGVFGECINSVDRKAMNEHLLTTAESYPNVTLHFNHRFVNMDLAAKTITFSCPLESAIDATSAPARSKGSISTKSTAEKLTQKVISYDLCIGCDGVYSKVRQVLSRSVRFNFLQHYIEHAYVELSIPPTALGEYAMDPNGLHIWPRQTFMMIALPNLDKSFTVTLFMPWEKFNAIKTEEDLVTFFEHTFPDSIPLMTKELLVSEYFKNEKGPLVTVKCSPYHYQSSLIILGDAAHAMVPFYGQGMNCGYEDCLVLDEIWTSILGPAPSNLPSSSKRSEPVRIPDPEAVAKILSTYTEIRNPDAEAICDLAQHNYIEMRSSVTKASYLWRKHIEGVLHYLFPKWIIPLYTMVSFTRIPYAKALSLHNGRTKYFDALWTVLGVGKVAVAISCASVVGLRLWSHWTRR